MLKVINLAELINPEKINQKADLVLKSHNPKAGQKINRMFNQDVIETKCSSKIMVPIKQYSNKFLRQSILKQNQRDKITIKHNRFTSIVNKHKVFQKKYQNLLGRHHICKTEPNQNQYQCFTTTHNFYPTQEHHEIEKTRVKTDYMIDKHTSRAEIKYFQKYQQKQGVKIPLQQEYKPKIRQELPQREQKISTSRALQLFSKIISKDKGQLLDKMKSCYQKRLLKDRIVESSKNLQAKQIVLFEKQKKYSFTQKGENKISIKTGLKFRKKKTSKNIHLFEEIENFQICGWADAN